MTHKLYVVSADHVHPDYRFTNKTVQATQNSEGTWFATASGLGCSKDYPTADDAVRALFEAEACTNIHW